MDNLTISMAKVQSSANSIRKQNHQLNDYLLQIHQTMRQLSSYWQSPAQTRIYTRFQSMIPVFDNYRVIVDSYASFLDQTVDTYQALERQLEANADRF